MKIGTKNLYFLFNVKVIIFQIQPNKIELN
jgi:hypothetical protein